MIKLFQLRGYSIPAALDKVSYESGQKYSKEFKNYSFTSVETIVLKLQ